MMENNFDNNNHLSSSNVNDENLDKTEVIKPSAFQVSKPLMPPSTVFNANINAQPMETIRTPSQQYNNSNIFTRQVSLNHTMKGNKNLNIVILERNSPTKKRRMSRTKKSGIMEADNETNELKGSFTIREENDFINEYYPQTPGIYKSSSPFAGTYVRSKSNPRNFNKESHSDNEEAEDNSPALKLIYSRKEGKRRKTQTHYMQDAEKSHNIANIEKDVEVSINRIQLEEVDTKVNANEVDNDNFNFGIQQERRYRRKDISNAKNYFKYRYISEKLIEINNLVDQNINNPNVLKNIYNSSSKDHHPVVYSADDKNVIKFTCIFLQKIEKAIFLFNMKKFEESFNYLKESNIIKNENEFGEILLIFPGFDKFIIGDFLAKEKKPNESLVITKIFIGSMDFRGEKFLDSFRFLLSRMNLPKDSTLILNIIDIFSTVYFNDNKESNLFKHTTAVYLMASTILALNTSFHRKLPNAQMTMIKKEEFVKMNEDADPSLSEEIYEEIRNKKLDIIYDYNEQIYRKIEIKAEDFMKTSKKEMVNINSANMNTFNVGNTVGVNMRSEGGAIMLTGKGDMVNGEELINMLKAGEVFVKYGKSGDPHERFIFLSADEQKLHWRPMNCTCFSRERTIKTVSLGNIYIGASNSQIFEKYKISPEFELNCFSIIADKRSLDLKHGDPKICRKWYQAIRYLIKRVKSMAEVKKKKLKELSNRKEIISDFWRTEILPNWSQYRKFLLIKGNSNCQNQFFSNNEIYKKNIKNILNEKKKVTKLVIDEKDKQDVAYLWFLGIPDWLRKKMWSLVIANDINFNENLFNFFLRTIENIEFHGDTAIDRKRIRDVTPCHDDNDHDIVGDFDGIPIIEENKMQEVNYQNIDNPLVSEIVLDIHKSYKKFEEFIKNENIEEKRFKEELFKILRVFNNYRPDITYSRQIAYIATVFYLNSEDFYQAFILTANFIIPSYLVKFLMRDEIFIKTRCQFFEKLLLNYTPLVYKHLKNLDINIRLFFYDWVEFLYTKTFKYETILRIWDCYLAKGEIFIYEVGLALIMLQEKDLLNSVKFILTNLSTFPERYTEDDLFEMVEKIDINNEYSTLIEHDELAQEKSQLYSAFLYY